MENSTKEAWTGGKNISPEAKEKRKLINKKIFKFGCLPIIIVFGLLVIIGIFMDEPVDSKSNDTKSTSEKVDPLMIGQDVINALIGNKVPFDKWNIWGNPETLEGTDNQFWVVYLDSANISFVSDKSTQIVLFADFNKNSALDYLNGIKEKRKKQIEAQFSQWDGSHIILTKAIKEAMNDPKSYEHVETVYWEMNDHLIVQMKYRGNNAFGGKVLAMVKAKVGLDGQILEIIEQQ